MQHINASDYMVGSAKRAVEAALSDAKAQRVGGAAATALDAALPSPEAASPAQDTPA